MAAVPLFFECQENGHKQRFFLPLDRFFYATTVSNTKIFQVSVWMNHLFFHFSAVQKFKTLLTMAFNALFDDLSYFWH